MQIDAKAADSGNAIGGIGDQRFATELQRVMGENREHGGLDFRAVKIAGLHPADFAIDAHAGRSAFDEKQVAGRVGDQRGEPTVQALGILRIGVLRAQADVELSSGAIEFDGLVHGRAQSTYAASAVSLLACWCAGPVCFKIRGRSVDKSNACHPTRNAPFMYIHTFLFQWNQGVTAEVQQLAAERIRALQGRIPGLLETSYGANISPRSQGFTHGGVMKFQDAVALEAYNPHPIHQELVRWLMPLLKVAAELDYEI
jgi:hypothetical protein